MRKHTHIHILNDYAKQYRQKKYSLNDNKDHKEPTYIVYLRKSTKGKKKNPEEEQQKDSLKRQRSVCQRYVIDKKLKVVGYIEEKESAFVSGKRKRFDEILNEIKKEKGKRKYDSILAFTPDRLSRNMKEAGEIIDLLDSKTLIDLKFSAFHLENDYNGLMNLGIHFVMAKQYSDNISAHTKTGNQKKQERGYGLAHPRHGYKFESKDYHYFRPDGKNFKLLKEAFNKAIYGEPLTSIRDYLIDNNFKYKNKVQKVSKQKLSKIFADPFYAGLYVIKSKIVNLQEQDPLFKPMLTAEEFIALRERLDKHKGFKKKYTTSDNILYKGMVDCEYCGHTMTPVKPQNHQKQRYLYLQCNNKERCIRYSIDERAKAKKEGKKLKGQVRSKIIRDFIKKLLSKGIQIDKKLYKDHMKGEKTRLQKKLDSKNNELFSIRRQMNEKEDEIDNKLNSLNYLDNKSSRVRMSKRIDLLSKTLDQLEQKEKDYNKNIIKLKIEVKREALSYEEFKNYFKYVNGIIQNSENRYAIDSAIRSVFLNFTLNSEEVATYTLNPEIEPYVKVGGVSHGVDNGT